MSYYKEYIYNKAIEYYEKFLEFNHNHWAYYIIGCIFIYFKGIHYVIKINIMME